MKLDQIEQPYLPGLDKPIHAPLKPYTEYNGIWPGKEIVFTGFIEGQSDEIATVTAVHGPYDFDIRFASGATWKVTFRERGYPNSPTQQKGSNA